MTGELGRARSELEDLNRTLEERVQEKTRELERDPPADAGRSRRWPPSASWPRSSRTRSTTRSPGIRTYARLLRRRLGGLPEGGAASSEQTPRPTASSRWSTSEAGRCGDIVRNLLAFSRTSGARFAEEDLAPILERCRLLLRHQAELLGVTLDGERRPGPAARRLRRRPGAAGGPGPGHERARGDARRAGR